MGRSKKGGDPDSAASLSSLHLPSYSLPPSLCEPSGVPYRHTLFGSGRVTYHNHLLRHSMPYHDLSRPSLKRHRIDHHSGGRSAPTPCTITRLRLLHTITEDIGRSNMPLFGTPTSSISSRIYPINTGESRFNGQRFQLTDCAAMNAQN